MRRTSSALILLFLSGTLFSQPAPEPKPILGFTPESARRQHALEAGLDSRVKRDNLREWMKRMSAQPHHLGSPYGKENAEFMAKLFRSWGYDTRIERFDVLFPTPTERRLELLEPERFTALLAEPAVEGDPTSAIESLPTYNAYSADGDVTGELVYVNYGIPEDYEELSRRGIDVRGKIVIARYGGSWRGIKPKVAAENGAIGCIIYSDPRDDGYAQGDVYPKGPFRGEHGVQRGSVADMPLYAGDPLTPGVGATDKATRLPIAEAKTLASIPTLPISYSDALPLLRALDGPMAPVAWRGALPITYQLGPGPAMVRLKVAFDWKLAPAYNVIAMMKGSEHPDEWIIRGNHHDAWNFGANDPVSGMVALLEEARIIGELAAKGSRPKRTVVYAAWDGEEQGLLGSTEWVEEHAEELKRKAVAYINTDANGRGFLYVAGSHTLEKFVGQVGRDVKDPQKNVTTGERSRANSIVNAEGEARERLRRREDSPISALGSGSDFTPFIQHLGIASLHVGYGGENDGGEYHSAYDTFEHYTRFGDPGFQYGDALVRTAGRMTLRLANAEVLPFEVTNFVDTVAIYVDELKSLLAGMRTQTVERNRLIDEGLLALVSDPTLTYVVPPKRDVVPHLNFAPMENAVARLRRAETDWSKVSGTIAGLSQKQRSELDAVLMQLERKLTRDDGLPGRPWYKHQIYAPGQYTGYGVKTLPAVREAIELRRWDEADAQIEVVAGTLERFAAEIERAAKIAE